jgi:hypothetical protein
MAELQGDIVSTEQRSALGTSSQTSANLWRKLYATAVNLVSRSFGPRFGSMLANYIRISVKFHTILKETRFGQNFISETKNLEVFELFENWSIRLCFFPLCPKQRGSRADFV